MKIFEKEFDFEHIKKVNLVLSNLDDISKADIFPMVPGYPRASEEAILAIFHAGYIIGKREGSSTD